MRVTKVALFLFFQEVFYILTLFPHQEEALKKIKNGSVIQGDVGSGKSLTALAYYHDKVCGGWSEKGEWSEMPNPIPLYIITTAKKRDDKEWDKDMCHFLLSSNDDNNYYSDRGAKVVVDSWNNIKKYVGITNAFFIFDEQRLVGYGTWVKSFLKIAKNNQWVLLTATPGDDWSELIPLFIAHGYYRNKTEFETLHCEFNPYTKWKQIKKYHNIKRLVKQKEEIIVEMPFKKPAVQHHYYELCKYDKDLYLKTMKYRWDPYKNEPFQNASALCYSLRKIVNSDSSRIDTIHYLYNKYSRIIIFYNFDYELEALKRLCETEDIVYGEWNGHKHDPVPSAQAWLYLVQYSAGCEGWNCITCDTIIFYSQSYSYKQTVQAAGRIDRLNTPFRDLNYYHLTSKSQIDVGIEMALKKKKNFNEKKFIEL